MAATVGGVLGTLPPEVLIRIFHHVDGRDALRCQRLSKFFKKFLRKNMKKIRPQRVTNVEVKIRLDKCRGIHLLPVPNVYKGFRQVSLRLSRKYKIVTKPYMWDEDVPEVTVFSVISGNFTVMTTLTEAETLWLIFKKISLYCRLTYAYLHNVYEPRSQISRCLRLFTEMRKISMMGGDLSSKDLAAATGDSKIEALDLFEDKGAFDGSYLREAPLRNLKMLAIHGRQEEQLLGFNDATLKAMPRLDTLDLGRNHSNLTANYVKTILKEWKEGQREIVKVHVCLDVDMGDLLEAIPEHECDEDACDVSLELKKEHRVRDVAGRRALTILVEDRYDQRRQLDISAIVEPQEP